jgi:4-hydroxybenzoate polyprenyltransferase
LNSAIRKFLSFFLFSNIFVSISAIALLHQTYYQLNLQWSVDWLTVFVFASTLFNYSFQRMLPVNIKRRATLTPLMEWMIGHKYLIWTLTILSFLLMGFSFLQLDFSLWPLIVITGIFALLYDIPVKILGLKTVRLRETGLLKIFIIGLAWGSATVLFPAMHAGISILETNVLILFFQRTFFIIAITLPFDLRDVVVDSSYELTTLPNILGEKASNRLSAFLIICFVVLEGFRGYIFEVTTYLPALLITGVVTLFLIFGRKKEYGFSYYLGWLDGMMVLQFLLVYLSFWLI